MIPGQARAAAWAATLTGKLVLWAIAAALVALAGWKLYHIPYDQGVADERAAWVTAQEKAAREQLARQDAQEAAARAAGEASRDKGADQRQAASTAATKTSEAIQREYQSKPDTAAPCATDGRPAPLPDRVQDELRKARRSAEAASR